MRRKHENNVDLRALFEAGERLDFAWVEFSRFFDRFALQLLQTHPNSDEDLRELNPERYEQLAKGWLPKSWEARQKKLQLRTHDERANLLFGIYYGDLWALGFKTLNDGSDVLARVPRQHFFVDYEQEEPFPDINWNKGELRADGNSYFDIHVARCPKAAELVPANANDRSGSNEDAERESSPRGPPGRPSKAGVIHAAIENYAANDPELSGPKIERFRSYKAYISEQGFNPHTEPGFSDKTIEKYETQYRNRSR